MDGRECGGAPQPHPDHHGGELRPLRARGYGVCDRQQRGGDTPWPTQDKDGDNILNTSEFFEGGLNLTRMGLAFGCFNKVIFDTRSSQSLTATLFDFTLGTFLTCNDGNACTADTCDPTRGCLFATIACDDGNVCTDDTCNPATGCFDTNNTALCSDGNACTTNDRCGGGRCVGGASPNCDDGNVCTDDTCNSATGCAHTNNAA